MSICRFGIIGAGSIAAHFCKGVKLVEGAEVVAVASSSQERAKAFAQANDVPEAYGSYEQMLQKADINVVYVATTHNFHMDNIRLCFDYGKHVLCEKAMVLTAADAREVFRMAREKNLFCMEAMWTRFLPAIEEAQRIVASGEIGEIRAIEADFCYRTAPNAVPRLYLPDLAGGSLLDVGVYGLHFAAIFLGSAPETLLALGHTDQGVDIHTSILLKYKDGAIANITSAIGVAKPESGYIYGTEGWITFPCFYGPQELTVHTHQGERRIEKPYVGNGFEEEILEVCRCIREGKRQSDIMPLGETITILRQMDAVREQIGLRYPFE